MNINRLMTDSGYLHGNGVYIGVHVWGLHSLEQDTIKLLIINIDPVPITVNHDLVLELVVLYIQ